MRLSTDTDHGELIIPAGKKQDEVLTAVRTQVKEGLSLNYYGHNAEGAAIYGILQPVGDDLARVLKEQGCIVRDGKNTKH